MRKTIKKILKEEINDFEWTKEIEPSQEEVIQFIKDNGIAEWKFGEHWVGNLDLYETSIQNLGNLKSVDGDLYLYGTTLSKKYSEEEIRTMVDVRGDIYT